MSDCEILDSARRQDQLERRRGASSDCASGVESESHITASGTSKLPLPLVVALTLPLRLAVPVSGPGLTAASGCQPLPEWPDSEPQADSEWTRISHDDMTHHDNLNELN